MEDGSNYSLEDYPYVAEILDCKSRFQWVMKGAQTGLTEAAKTQSLFEIDVNQRDVLYYFPTGRMAERFSKTRFSAAINLSPYLRSVVKDSVELKQIGNATLHILGANSLANLKGTSVARLFMDELDDWTPRQIYLAEERVSGQRHDDVIVRGFSTPKFPNTGIHKQYLNSTQERFFFDCPHCHEEIKLDWEDSFVVKGERVDDPAVHDSYLKCSKCDEKLDHETKKDWLATGRWKATNPDADPEHCRGFHISQLYSTSPMCSPGHIAIKYLRGMGDEHARQTFWNDCLGLPYIDDAYQVNDVHIDACVKKGGLFSTNDEGVQPTAASDGIFTLGIDQGGPTHHWVAVRWMFDATRYGDPNDRAIGKVVGLGKCLQDDWDTINGLMRGYMVRRAVIDYFPDPTNARVFARKFMIKGEGRVYLCQYITGTSGREIRIVEDEYGAGLVKCDKVGWLSKTLGRVMAEDIEFPVDIPLEFRQHLKAPIRTLKEVDGKPVAEYVDNGPDHYAHALNYAEIALKILDPGLHSSSIITNIRE
jgi:hypothetical protein